MAAPPPLNAWTARAAKPVPFRRLVRVELSKLVATRAARIMITVGVVVDVAVIMLAYTLWILTMEGPYFASAYRQIALCAAALRISQLALHSAVIMLVAGEWQHRSAQNVLLLQPSRLRYAAAQGSVALIVGLAASILHVGLALTFGASSLEGALVVPILHERPGWTVLVITTATLIPMAVAFFAALGLRNIAAALGVYVLVVPLMLLGTAVMPGLQIWTWIDPFSVLRGIADTTDDRWWPAVGSVLLWASVAALALWKAVRREAA